MTCKRLGTTIGAAAVATVLATAANATIIIEADSAGSTEGIGLFTGSISYLAGSPTQGALTITLTNTSEPGNGGFITGFAFNIYSTDASATASLTSAGYPFLGVTSHAAPPFGPAFTAGAALGGDWSGGGIPNFGIGVGDTGTFTFDVFAMDAGSLNAGSFLHGPYDFNFVVRFRGFVDGGSDKVPAIPGPATLALLAMGVLIGRRRVRAGSKTTGREESSRPVSYSDGARR